MKTTILKMVYCSLLVVCAAYTLLYVSVFITIATASPEKIAGYPFGSTELSFNYCSKEVYQAVAGILSYIGITTLITSAFLYWRTKHTIAATIVLAVPVLLEMMSTLRS